MARQSVRQCQVYALQDPEQRITKYIGYTTTSLTERLAYHMMDERDNPRTRWIQGLLKRGLAPIIVTLEFVPTRAKLPEREIWWIAFGKTAGWPLLNQSAGGESPPRYNNDGRRGARKVGPAGGLRVRRPK